ncbi:metallophosphoesterase [Bradyrhizobium icense]|uniref:metallophosphoesterase n=1 Tax=Bradyrhizobium icense TaxID=1274631 RepID=UPI001F16FA59|nr:metallophosphoesterase [Bradyrhizobium icense]
MKLLVQIIDTLACDICVLTGDYRGKTYGPIEIAMEAVANLRAKITLPVYAVLGNHDTIEMVPRLEDMDIRVLMNQCEILKLGDEQLYLAD